MSMPALHEVRDLAAGILSVPDVRPQWLKNLPSAMDEGVTHFGRYYRFFYEFAKRWKPQRILEIGTFKGSSIAHFADGNPEGQCVTIDIDDAAIQAVRALKIGNVTALQGDSAEMVRHAQAHGPFDVLFIDALHDFNHCYGEYLHYRPLVNAGGIIFFDDIHVCSQMSVAWEYIPDPKVELPELHYTGFGACRMDPAVLPRTWNAVIAEATAKF